MPIYDYSCSACGHVTEVIHGINDEAPRFCPACGRDGTLRKAFAPPAVHFKGSGWAKKDRKATSAPGRMPAKASTATGDGGGSSSDTSAAGSSGAATSSGAKDTASGGDD